MTRTESSARARAAELAEELSAGRAAGRALEWVEQLLGTALLEAVREERERCAAIADRRIGIWEQSGRRMSSPAWPPDAAAEARARRNEAEVIADAIRAGVDT